MSSGRTAIAPTPDETLSSSGKLCRNEGSCNRISGRRWFAPVDVEDPGKEGWANTPEAGRGTPSATRTATMKRFGLAILAIALGLFVAVAALEAAVKMHDVYTRWRDQRIASRISRVSPIPGVRYELVENVVSKTPGQEIPVRINNLGFRGRDLTVEKPEDGWRAAILGDSIAFGRTLPEEEIFASRLEASLAALWPDRTVEIVNASLSGRDTWEELALLEHRVVPLEPDLVIVQICMNDHVQLPFPKGDTHLGVFGEVAWYDYSSLLALLDRRIPGFRKWHVRALRAFRIDRRSEERVILDHWIDPGRMFDVKPHWDDWSRALLGIRDVAREAGAETLFVVFPIDRQITKPGDTTLPILTRFAREQGLELLDMRGPFHRAGKPVLQDYTHPNARGHAIVAREIERWIVRRSGKPA